MCKLYIIASLSVYRVCDSKVPVVDKIKQTEPPQLCLISLYSGPRMTDHAQPQSAVIIFNGTI